MKVYFANSLFNDSDLMYNEKVVGNHKEAIRLLKNIKAKGV